MGEEPEKKRTELCFVCPYCNTEIRKDCELEFGKESFDVFCEKCKKDFRVDVTYKGEQIEGEKELFDEENPIEDEDNG